MYLRRRSAGLQPRLQLRSSSRLLWKGFCRDEDDPKNWQQEAVPTGRPRGFDAALFSARTPEGRRPGKLDKSKAGKSDLVDSLRS